LTSLYFAVALACGILVMVRLHKPDMTDTEVAIQLKLMSLQLLVMGEKIEPLVSDPMAAKLASASIQTLADRQETRISPGKRLSRRGEAVRRQAEKELGYV